MISSGVTQTRSPLQSSETQTSSLSVNRFHLPNSQSLSEFTQEECLAFERRNRNDKARPFPIGELTNCPICRGSDLSSCFFSKRVRKAPSSGRPTCSNGFETLLPRIDPRYLCRRLSLAFKTSVYPCRDANCSENPRNRISDRLKDRSISAESRA